MVEVTPYPPVFFCPDNSGNSRWFKRTLYKEHAGHTESYHCTLERKRGPRDFLNVSLRLHCVQEECALFQNKERLCKRFQTLHNVLLVRGMGSRQVASTREKRRNSVNFFIHRTHSYVCACRYASPEQNT